MEEWMHITPELRKGLQRAIDEYGNVSQFAKAIGVAHSTVLFWLSGKSPNISGRVWIRKVRPVLLPFLTPEKEQIGISGFFDSQVTPFYRKFPLPENFDAPLLSWKQAAELEPSVEPIQESISRSIKLTVCRFARPVRESHFALEFTGGFVVPLYGLIGGGEYPAPDDLVLAKLRSPDKLLLARLFRREDDFTLVSAEKVYRWNSREQPDCLCWCFPVLEFTRILRTS